MYPVKSLAGISLAEAQCESIGLKGDRRYMLIDNQGNFLSQRELPILTQISNVELTNEHVRMKIDNQQIELSEVRMTEELVKVTIWGQEVSAALMDEKINQSFSNFLKIPTRVVYLNDDTAREKLFVKDPGRTHVSFADGYPYLVTSQQSLDFLNHHVEDDIPIDRFRTNIHLDAKDKDPFFEDDLEEFNIGSAKFKIVKPCARCTVINTDQQTGNRLKEPLKTLSLLRKKGNKIYFGANAICTQTGSIKIDDKITSI